MITIEAKSSVKEQWENLPHCIRWWTAIIFYRGGCGAYLGRTTCIWCHEREVACHCSRDLFGRWCKRCCCCPDHGHLKGQVWRTVSRCRASHSYERPCIHDRSLCQCQNANQDHTNAAIVMHCCFAGNLWQAYRKAHFIIIGVGPFDGKPVW